MCDGIEEIPSLKKDTCPRSSSDCREIAKRDTYDQCARARDDKEYQSTIKPVGKNLLECRIEQTYKGWNEDD